MSTGLGWIDPAVLSTAFLAGLLGSGHCFAMCGGIAAGLGAMSRGRGGMPALQFNLARLTTYAILGLISASILGGLSDIAQVGRWLRLLTALMIFMIGLRFLFDFRGLELIERGGAGLWKKIMPIALRAGERQDWIGRVTLGLCWGFLPCGLVYTLLLTAASTGSPAGGALTMFVFGAGTLPSMMGLTMAAPALSTFLEDRVIRKVIGFALIVLALWTLVMLWGVHQGQMNHANHVQYAG
jgi:sulfite exporter TauE/SafE